MPKLIPKLLPLRAGELVAPVPTPYMKRVPPPGRRGGAATESSRKYRPDRHTQSRPPTRRESAE